LLLGKKIRAEMAITYKEFGYKTGALEAAAAFGDEIRRKIGEFFFSVLFWGCLYLGSFVVSVAGLFFCLGEWACCGVWCDENCGAEWLQWRLVMSNLNMWDYVYILRPDISMASATLV
jgi:hypothetical protein